MHIMAQKMKSHISLLHIHSARLKSLVMSEPSWSSESHLNYRSIQLSDMASGETAGLLGQ